MMRSVNRMAIVVMPREPFLAWASSLDATARVHVSRTDFTSVYLVNESDPYSPKQVIRKHFKMIFAELLNSWHTDESQWPARRTEKLFHEWFDTKVVDLVWDFGRGGIVGDD